MPQDSNLQIIRFQVVDSTMDIAYQMAKNLERRDFVVLADEQNQGKGRGQNRWYSPKGGFWATYVLFFDKKLAHTHLRFFHYAIAVAIIETLGDFVNVDLKIKWPNDIIFRDKKLGGVLLEHISGGSNYLLVGIGLNIFNSITSLPEDLQAVSSSLCDVVSPEFSFNKFAYELYVRILKRLEEILNNNIQAFVEEFNSLLFNLEKKVRYKNAEYFCKGINEAGYFIIKRDSQEKKLLIEDSIELNQA